MLDKEGNVAAQFLRNYPLDQHVGQRGMGPQPASPTIAQVHVPGTQQDTVYDVYWPVRVEGSPEPWGVIRLGVSLQGLRKDIAQTRWQIAGNDPMAHDAPGEEPPVKIEQSPTRDVRHSVSVAPCSVTLFSLQAE